MSRYYLADKTDAILPRSGGRALAPLQRHLVTTPARHPCRDHPEVLKTPHPDAWPLDLTLDHQVAFADLYLDHDGFTALVVEPFFDSYQAAFRESLAHLAPCRLSSATGKRPRDYVFGTIRHRFLAYAVCDFTSSRFALHEDMALRRHHTAILRGEVPFDTPPPALSTGLAFDDLAAYVAFLQREENWLNTLLPERLHLSVAPSPLFHFSSTDLWLSEPLALALRDAERPGMLCPGPAIEVTGP